MSISMKEFTYILRTPHTIEHAHPTWPDNEPNVQPDKLGVSHTLSNLWLIKLSVSGPIDL